MELYADVGEGFPHDAALMTLVTQGWGCHVDEVVRWHLDARFTVVFCGFAPGFAYCTSEPALPEVPRSSDPRTEVPAGSVALAGRYCGIYRGSLVRCAQLRPGERVWFQPARRGAPR